MDDNVSFYLSVFQFMLRVNSDMFLSYFRTVTAVCQILIKIPH